jgi:hypothetical protein
MLLVTMSDGSCINGVGCVVGLNTVLTCAKLLVKEDCTVVEIRFLVDILLDKAVIIRVRECKVVPSDKHSNNLALLILEDENAHLKCGKILKPS